MPDITDAKSMFLAEAKTKGVKESTNDFKKFDDTLEHLGKTYDSLQGKIRLMNQVFKLNSKGILTVTQRLQQTIGKYNRTITTKQVGDTSARITKITESEKPKAVRSLVSYKAIKQEAELVSSVTKRLADGTKQLRETFRVAGEDGVKTYTAINKKIVEAKNEQPKVNKSMSAFEKLWSRIKSVAVYRGIRTAMKMITSSITESVENLAKFDSGTNQTVSQLNSSLQVLKNSVGVAIMPLVQAITPLVQTLSTSVASLANGISYVTAKLKGNEKYLKVNTEYFKQFNKQVNLLSFDKFEALSDTGTAGMFEEQETATSSIAKELSEVNDIIKLIGEALILFGTYKLVSWITSGGIKDFGEKVKDVFGNLKKGMTDTNSKALAISSTVAGIFVLVDGISEITQWKDLSGWERFFAILKLIAGALAVIFGIVSLIIPAVGWVKAVAGISMAVGLGATAISGIAGFEKGGIPDKSELFYMNEYGRPEALVNTGGTQTNVINIEQLSMSVEQAFTRAIYNTGLLDAMQQSLVVDGRNIDNSAFARAIFPALKTESRRQGGNQL